MTVDGFLSAQYLLQMVTGDSFVGGPLSSVLGFIFNFPLV